MNPHPENGNGSIVPFLALPNPKGFEVSWAGEFSAPDASVPPLFGLGSIDGQLLFADQEFTKVIERKGPRSGSGEAINGVAQVDAWVAVSTRNEVSFWATTKPQGAAAPLGAHGVTATRSGYFIAPLGQSGLLIAVPLANDASLAVHTPGDGSLYIYRAICLRSPSGADVLACAARRAGLVAGVFAASQQANPMTTAKFENIDIIDVCPLCPDVDSLAVAALGRDGSIILSRDVLTDKRARTFKFQSVSGVAYRILSHRGDLYVLTSRGLFVLGALAARFVNGETTKEITTPIMPLPIAAVDMNAAWGRWLLVVLADEVLRFDLDLIHDFVPQHIGNGHIQELHSIAESTEPTWADVGSKTTSMALAS